MVHVRQTPQRTMASTRPLRLAHHPLCSTYRTDVLKVGSHYLCLGCSVAYPLALILVALYLLVPGVNAFPMVAWLTLGLMGGSIQLLSLKGYTRTKATKIMVKLGLGLGLGAMTLFVFNLPGPIWYRMIVFVICLQGLSLMGAQREKVINGTCRECPYRGNWENCPGFHRPGHAGRPEQKPTAVPVGLARYPIPALGDEAADYTDPRTGERLRLPRPLP